MLLPNQIAAALTPAQTKILRTRKVALRVGGFDLVLASADGVLRRTDLGCDVLDIVVTS